MPYQAESDTTIPRVIGRRANAVGERVAVYESVNYATGAVIFEEDIAPHVLRRLEEGDDHLSSLLRYVDEAEAQNILAAQSGGSRPAPETEVLRQEDQTLGSEGTIPPSPAVGPEFEGDHPPPYEAPPVSGDVEVSDAGTSSEESPPSLPEAEQEAAEAAGEAGDTATAEETPEGASESDGAVEVEDEVAEEAAAEDQEAGQDQAAETQEDDRFESMDRKALIAEAKEAKIPGRTKMSEDDLRTALRSKAE